MRSTGEGYSGPCLSMPGRTPLNEPDLGFSAQVRIISFQTISDIYCPLEMIPFCRQSYHRGPPVYGGFPSKVGPHEESLL